MEKFFTVEGIEYIVSTDGKIYSTNNIGRGKYHKEIKQRKNHDGYMVITTGKTGDRKTRFVHRIIAQAFIPNPLGLPEVDHIDRNRTNNDVSNLRWIDSLENKRRTPFEVRSKTHKGELNGRAMLSENDVLLIRDLFKNGKPQYQIAKEFGRGWSTIHNIIIRNTWKDI